MGAEPPIIIISLQNNSFLNDNNVNLTINVKTGNSVLNSSRWIDLVYYTIDWQQENTYVYRYMNDEINPISYSTSLNLAGINDTQIPEGQHTLTVYAVEEGQRLEPPVPSELSGLKKIVYYSFQITGSTSVTFTIDRTIPNVLLLSIENMTYTSKDIPLNFTVNESTSKIAYNLDNNGNTTIAGNTTLTDLSIGEHNLIVYAWDTAGNVEASEIVSFRIVEPFPILDVAIVTLAMAFIVALAFSCSFIEGTEKLLT